MRFERKYYLENHSAGELNTVIRLNRACFFSAHPPRQINNIYLDGLGLDSFVDNVEGNLHRRKIRIRWYGNLCGLAEQPTLEIKIKNSFLGTKKSYPLHDFKFDSDFGKYHLEHIFQTNTLPIDLTNELLGLKIALINSYQRNYFLSADTRIRLTLDTDLRYFQMGFMGLKPLQHPLNDAVIELKYKNDDDDLAIEVARDFPFRLSKSSKYAMGISLINY